MLKFATVCSSNMNRSMEAHCQLKARDFVVRSFGTGTNVRLPGPTQDKPNVYEFGTPYRDILEDLRNKDLNLYTQNGLIGMLERNVRIKEAPERWQDLDRNVVFDVVLTYEERVFDSVLQELQGRDSDSFKPVHVINIETRDNHDEAVVSARLSCELCDLLNKMEDVEGDAFAAAEAFEARNKRELLYSLMYV